MLKTDIVRFFPNVDHEVLRGVISRRIADERVLALVDCIVASGEGVLKEEATATYFPGDDLFAISRPRGLPIGNLTSTDSPFRQRGHVSGLAARTGIHAARTACRPAVFPTAAAASLVARAR